MTPLSSTQKTGLFVLFRSVIYIYICICIGGVDSCHLFVIDEEMNDDDDDVKVVQNVSLSLSLLF